MAGFARLRRLADGIEGKQLFQKLRQILQRHHVRTIGGSVVRILVRLDEKACNADRNGGTVQPNVLRDSRMVDPIAIEDNENHGTNFLMLTMADYGEIALVSGLAYLAEAQAAIAHNLANVDSASFKRRTPRAVPIDGGFRTELGKVLPSVTYAETIDWTRGPVRPTGERSHVALGEGDFFRVRGADSRVYYTRQGSLLATAFHPEQTDDLRLHRYFLALTAGAGDEASTM